jgi:hypothetical protein
MTKIIHNFFVMKKTLSQKIFFLGIVSIVGLVILYSFNSSNTQEEYLKELKEYREKKRDDTLVINYHMFKRYKKPRVRFHGMTTKNVNTYQMYLYGYHDARKNHNYFLKYLKPLPV